MMAKEMTDRLKNALTVFTTKCEVLLRQDPHEDAITDEFKTFLKSEFKEWEYSISHNYDKRIVNNELVKKQTQFLIERLPKLPANIDPNSPTIIKEILPDLIFHDLESSDHNFMIIEIKKTTNKKKADREMDLLKLEVTTSFDLRYDYGVFIDFATGDEYSKVNPVSFKLFANGKIIHEEKVELEQ